MNSSPFSLTFACTCTPATSKTFCLNVSLISQYRLLMGSSSLLSVRCLDISANRLSCNGILLLSLEIESALLCTHPALCTICMPGDAEKTVRQAMSHLLTF